MSFTSKEQRKKYNRRTRFGGNWDAVMRRDNFSCVLCGITSEEHVKKHKREIPVHHRDGNGRNSKNPNNSLDNLEVMCYPCHAYKHALERFKNKTTCKIGHPLELNYNGKQRFCRICKRAYNRRHYQEQKRRGDGY